MKTKQSPRSHAKKPSAEDRAFVGQLMGSSEQESSPNNTNNILYRVGWGMRLIGTIGTCFGLLLSTAFLAGGFWGFLVFLYFAPWFLASIALLILGHRLVKKHSKI